MPKVLVVEDETSAQILFEIAFKACGAELLLTDTTAGAKAMLAEHEDIDLVMIDGSLKGMDHGRDVADHIVNMIWPEQAKVGKSLTPFVTTSANRFERPEASGVYYKWDMLKMITTFGESQRLSAWVEEMKAAVPLRSAARSGTRAENKPVV